MATITKFEELDMWQKARNLSKDIFFYIEEGFERSSKLEFINFLSYSKGSAGEVKSQLYRAHDRNYLSEEKFQHLYARADEITKMTTSFIAYLNQATVKGQKFKDRL